MTCHAARERPPARIALEPVEAHVVERDGLRLVIDPVALAALHTARDAGIEQASDFGALPDLDELPLRVVCLEMRVEQLERKLGRYVDG